MSEKVVLDNEIKLGFGFIEGDEYKYRNIANGDDSGYRKLFDEEVEILKANGCTADSWDNILVKDGFIARNVIRVAFYGKNRIGTMSQGFLRFHDFVQPCGISDSRIISCDIGNYCAVHSVSYMSHYIVDDYVMLVNIFEMQTTNHSKFGNGIVKEGESPDVRIDLSVMNENLGRRIAPFEDLLCADACLWADNPSDRQLNKALWNLTDISYSKKLGWYGRVGENTVVKNCQIIKDVNIGGACYIKGCTKLKNLTIKSSDLNPTQIGEGCELVNGIVGYGCRIFYGCKAIRFVMQENSTLKYGARLINSVLGDNSTVSCCEVLSNLIFPYHEQHHNNSFLISALIKGQSNMAAGANIGSNHNSRAADGELRAGRGFWPALSSTIKYDSTFASFVLIAKGNYNNELCIPLPFSLLVSNSEENRREIMPAYWWMYNMYALERNSAKFLSRDKRKFKLQHIETDYLAPDTVSEIFDAIEIIEKCMLESDGQDVYARGFENSAKPVRIIKAKEGLEAYRNMLVYYGIKESVKYCALQGIKFSELQKESHNGTFEWENLGGQLVPSSKVNRLKEDIKAGKFKSWKQLHETYDFWAGEYNKDKAFNAVLTLQRVTGLSYISKEKFKELCNELKHTRQYMENQILTTRKKDYDNPFRKITYRNDAERDAVMGALEKNQIFDLAKETTAVYMGYISKVVY